MKQYTFHIITHYFCALLLIIWISPSYSANYISLPLSPKSDLNRAIRVTMRVGNLKDNKYNPQKFDLILDLTSALTWIPSNKSLSNDSTIPKYTKDKSTAVVPLNKTVAVSELYGELYGELVNETFIVDDYYEVLTKNFTLLLVDSFTHYIGEHKKGKLGLGIQNRNVNYHHTSSVIDELYKNKLIDSKVFVIDKETLTIGKIPDQYKSTPTSNCQIVDTNDLDDEYKSGWMCEISHVLIDDNDRKGFKDSHEVFPSRVVFDTMSEYITIPMTYYDFFKKYLFSLYFYNDCSTKNIEDYTYLVCTKTPNFHFVNITFVIGGYGYVFKMEKLLKRDNENRIEVLLRFKKENDLIWTFGQPFINSMAVGFDEEKKSILFIGSERENYLEEWKKWNATKTTIIERSRAMMLADMILILIIMFLVTVWYFFKQLFVEKKEYLEHGPLIKQEERA